MKYLLIALGSGLAAALIVNVYLVTSLNHEKGIAVVYEAVACRHQSALKGVSSRSLSSNPSKVIRTAMERCSKYESSGRVAQSVGSNYQGASEHQSRLESHEDWLTKVLEGNE